MRNLFIALCGEDADDTEHNRKTVMEAATAYAKAKCIDIDQVKRMVEGAPCQPLLDDIMAHWASWRGNERWGRIKNSVRNNQLAPPHYLGVTNPCKTGSLGSNPHQPWTIKRNANVE